MNTPDSLTNEINRIEKCMGTVAILMKRDEIYCRKVEPILARLERELHERKQGVTPDLDTRLELAIQRAID